MKRTKQRYLALQLDSDVLPAPREFVDAIWSAVTKLYGEHGASCTNLAMIDYDAKNKTAVIRTALSTLDIVRTALAAITSFADKEAAVHVMGVSGTKKALGKKQRDSSPRI